MITQEYLHSVLDYNQDTGIFTWKKQVSNAIKSGDIAGGKHNRGYVCFKIHGKLYVAHRIVWIYVYGTLPKDQLDHINGIKSDNRLCNLREANNSENVRNQKLRKSNKSGFKGVSWNKRANKWVAQCRANGKVNFLGFFDSTELASKSYQEFAMQHHKEFFNSGI